MSHAPYVFVLCLSLGAAAACGGRQAAPAATPEAAPPGPPPSPPGSGEWDKWSHEKKLAYMKGAVLPEMGSLFHDFDSKNYAQPKCILCHGSGAEDGTFKMPNPGLPKLDFSAEGVKKMHDTKGAIADFMAKKVVPTMAQLVGEQAYDPQTQTGFGCLECHTKK